MAAINDRYGLIDDVNAGVITEDLYVVGAGNQQTIVEMVGAKKVNELQRWVIVYSLNLCENVGTIKTNKILLFSVWFVTMKLYTCN